MRWWINTPIWGGDWERLNRWGILFLHKVVEYGGLSFFFFVYHVQWPYFEQFKVVKDIPWPWLDKNPKVREKDAALQKRAWSYIMKFHIIVTIITYFMKPLQEAKDFVDPTKIPPWYITAVKVSAATIISEVGFYWGMYLCLYDNYDNFEA